jgi:alpha-galactosidase
VTIAKNSVLVVNNLYASYIWEGKKITSKDYSSREFNKIDTHDFLGKGTVFTIRYKKENLPDLIQSFYVYPDKDYLLTDFSLESKEETITSNYMSPVTIDEIKYLPETGDNRALFIPYDNDCWIRYQSYPLNFNMLRSYEVSAVFDNTSRKGIIVGSVEHDSWKTAVELTSPTPNHLGSLVCYGGVADTLTRDSKPHGALTGKTIKSPKVLLGFFDDWRNGLDAYGDANAALAPPKVWDKAVPFGWNSWGVLQFKLTYSKAMEVSDFFKDNLQTNHFVNPDKTLYVGLDSGWNSFTEEELKAFVKKCKENGQVAGVYWTPFTDWGKNPENTVQDAESYKFKDIYLYANGKPQQLDGAYAIDPTHPAIEERMKKTSELFHRCGFEYVKTDFMTHGAMEADRWYLPDITTGTQAYNYGMKLLDKYFGDMYINLSISPIFPAQYAQSRRIACDAWNKIKDTEYTMNALSYGWWIDRVYQYNDADHVVLRGATEGENRARVTSAAITGLFIAGDDFSKDGTQEGKDRAAQYLTNPGINAMATGVSFRPLEGNGEKSENQFMRKDESGTYYVYFNYGEESVSLTIPLERIGLKATGNYAATELWRNEEIDLRKTVEVPGKDVWVVLIK